MIESVELLNIINLRRGACTSVQVDNYSLPLSEGIAMRPFLTLADCNEALPDSSGHRPASAKKSTCALLRPVLSVRRTLRVHIT